MLYYFLEQNNLLDVPNETAAITAGSISQNDMESSDVRTYFREQLIWYRSDPQSMAGSIQAALTAGLPTDLEVALGEMWSSLFGGSATRLLTRSNLGIASRIKAGVYALKDAGVLTEQQVEDFYELGGGLTYPNIDAAAVQQAKDEKAAQDAAEAAETARLEAESALRQKWDDAMITAGADEAFYNGDEAALVIAINAAVATMG